LATTPLSQPGFTLGDLSIGLLEAIRDSVIYTDLEGRILYWNRGASRVFGYSAEEMLGRTPALLYPEEDFERLGADLARVLEGRDYVGEWRGRRKDGTEVWVDITTTLVRGPGGEPVGFLGSAKDVTQRKRAEEALQRARAEIRFIADAAPAYIAYCDADRRYRFVNQAYASRLGFTPAQVVGKHIWEVVGQEAYESFRGYVDQVLAGQNTDFEIEVPYEGIGRHYMHCAYAPEFGPDRKVVGLIAVITDVTERKRAEEAARESERQLRQLDRLEAVGRLAGGVAHEANNQMAVVLGMASFVLRNPALPAAVRQDITYIKEAAERTAAVSQQLLAFSRRQITQPRVLDLNQVIKGFEPVLRRTVGEDVVFRLDLAPDLPAIRADQGQLEQILLNLALNARDAMAEGGTIAIATRATVIEDGHSESRMVRVRPGRYVELHLSDTGHGMDPHTLSHLFEPFFTTKGVGRGTGLGLASVYGIIKQHEGYVFVDSTPGEGTQFEIFFPATPAAPGVRASAEGNENVGRGESVLVVEDDELVREVLVRGLRDAGFNVLQAENGLAALELAERPEARIDAVVTDLAMPGLRGRELADRLSQQRPGMPVLFVSAHATDELVRRGLLEPGQPFLQKPFDPETLSLRLRELLDAH